MKHLADDDDRLDKNIQDSQILIVVHNTMDNNFCVTAKNLSIMGNIRCTTGNNFCTMDNSFCTMDSNFCEEFGYSGEQLLLFWIKIFG